LARKDDVLEHIVLILATPKSMIKGHIWAGPSNTFHWTKYCCKNCQFLVPLTNAEFQILHKPDSGQMLVSTLNFQA